MTYRHSEIAQLERQLTAGTSATAGMMLAALAWPAPVLAQETEADSGDNAIGEGISSSFAVPVDELLRREHDSPVAELLDGLTVTPALNLPLARDQAGAQTNGAQGSASPTASLSLRYQPAGYWFAQASMYKYLDTDRRAPWNPDFTYSFGYDDWHPYTLSLVYSNYANNRFSPRKGDPVSPITHGTLTLGWKAPMPKRLSRLLLADDEQTIDCRMGLNTSPRFDLEDGSAGSWKTYANVGCRYPFTSRLYVDLNLFAYARGQQPWDPDFTYAFGLFDYRSNRFSIQYANYSGNRFPGRKRSPRSGRFADGGISISWNHGF